MFFSAVLRFGQLLHGVWEVTTENLKSMKTAENGVKGQQFTAWAPPLNLLYQ
jgi:hypothetical protein